MIEFIPWSQKVLNECIDMHKKGLIPSLDLELSSICTAANCIYCDSKPFVGQKMPNELLENDLIRLLKNAHGEGLKWVYTCGLGEPLEDKKFNSLLDFSIAHDISISVFTNGINIVNKKIAQKLKESGVHIVLKMDTFEESSFDKILGTKGKAIKVYKALDLLLDVGYGNNGEYTDLAFSIVPTTFSIEGIPKVIEFGLKNKIYPSVGELEKSGSVLIDKMDKKLSVPIEKLKEIKELLDIHFSGDYKRPICPSIITGIHFNNIGDCIVDKDTGLNCKWFMLKEPNVIVLGNHKEDIRELFSKLKKYRNEHFIPNKFNLLSQSKEMIFGGCGGKVNDIINLTLKSL